MTTEEKLKLEERVVEMLRTVFDPEIPVDIYSPALSTASTSTTMPTSLST